MHGLDHWFQRWEAGEAPSDLAITPEVAQLFPHITDEQQQAFIQGYQHAVEMDSAGFASEAKSYLEEWGGD